MGVGSERRQGEREGRTKGVLGLGVLDKGGVGRSVDEGSGQRVAPLFYSDGSGGRGGKSGGREEGGKVGGRVGHRDGRRPRVGPVRSKKH